MESNQDYASALAKATCAQPIVQPKEKNMSDLNLTKCQTCDAHGMIGGFVGGLAPGYESEVCPDCQGSPDFPRAKLIAAILTENGQPVSSPDEGSLDDVERERWNVCLEIVRRLDEWKHP